MMKRRITAALLAACLALGLGCTSVLAAAGDAKLETVRVLGIMAGDSAGNMNLSANVTRAEFVTMMTAASAYQDTVGSGYGVSLFKDVKSDHWASEYIKLAVEQGWMSGYVDGTFRPDQNITLEEGCTALLRLLGYNSGSLAGSFPTAQLSKAGAIGLLDDVSAQQGQALTRSHCVDLFYNLLLAQNITGAIYGTTLGYTVKNGEVDYATLVTADTKGPYVAGSGGGLTLPFSAGGVTVYRDGAASSLSAVNQYDVYYYNVNLRTVWVYSQRVTGTLTGLSPSSASPTAATVAGITYDLGTSSAAYKLSSQGSFAQGDLVTLLLGMDGDVVDVVSAQESESVYYGVVVSSAKAASTSSTSASSASEIQTVTQVACTDGVVRTFYHGTGSISAGRLVTVTVAQSGTTVKSMSTKRLEGSVSADGARFAGYDFADGVQILDTDDSGGYARIYPSRLAGAKLTSDEVRYYSLDANGDIDRLVLKQATGDTWDYAYVSRADNTSSEMSTSGSYEYVLNGQTQAFSANKVYSVQIGGAALIYEDGELKTMRQLTSVSIDQLSDLYAMSGNQKYNLAENLQVLLRDSAGTRGYYATTLSEINTADFELKGWYDNLGCPAGGRIRIIVATPKI